MLRPLFASAALASACAFLFVACGGNVVVDKASETGSGGTGATIITPTGTTTVTTGTTTTSTVTTGTTTTSTTVTTTTVTTSTTTGTLPCGGTVLVEDPSCQDCVAASCCAELAACAEGTPCSQLYACFLGCAPHDTSCQSFCFGTFSDGLPELQNLASCSQGACADLFECAIPVCDTGAAAVGVICGQCIAAGCCAETQACIDDPDCLPCFENPGSPACMANAAFAEIVSCFDTWCTPLCF